MSEPAERFFTGIGRYIETARALLAEGREPDLAGMDALAEQLAAEAAALTAEARARYAARLEALMADLEALASEMSARRGQVAQEMQSLPQLRKAAAAYRTAVGGAEKKDQGG